MPVAEHEGTHTQRPPEHVWPVGQVPVQSPPHPLGVPHAAPAGHVALQGTQAPPTQRVPAAQGEAQVHESTQRPSTQRSPAVHVTPAQGLTTQRPATQTVPLRQVTPAQGSGGAQVRWQAVPSGQATAQGAMGAQRPPVHHEPAAQVTLAQGSKKQPGMHTPLTQVVRAGHATPAQGFRTGTQLARQAVPRAQAIPAAAQGSGTHSLRMHAWPTGQVSPVQNIP